MRGTSLVVLSLFVTTLCACGGGAASGGGDSVVQGKVISRDGSTLDLGGIGVASLGDHVEVVTDSAGAFRLAVRAGAPIRLRFDDPQAEGDEDEGDGDEGEDDGEEGDGEEGEGDGEDGDDQPREDEDGEDEDGLDERDDERPDGADIDGDEVEIAPLDEGEVCEIEVEIEDGKVVECWIERDGAEREGESRLTPPEGVDSDAIGEVEIACGPECCELEVEVAHLAGPALYDLVLVDPETGTRADLGLLEVNAEGSGHFSLRVCEGDPLPFGAAVLTQLSGFGLQVLDGGGSVVLEGDLPEEDEKEADDFEEEDDDHEEEEGEDEHEEGEGEGEGEGDGERRE